MEKVWLGERGLLAGAVVLSRQSQPPCGPRTGSPGCKSPACIFSCPPVPVGSPTVKLEGKEGHSSAFWGRAGVSSSQGHLPPHTEDDGPVFHLVGAGRCLETRNMNRCGMGHRRGSQWNLVTISCLKSLDLTWLSVTTKPSVPQPESEGPPHPAKLLPAFCASF